MRARLVVVVYGLMASELVWYDILLTSLSCDWRGL